MTYPQNYPQPYPQKIRCYPQAFMLDWHPAQITVLCL